MKREPRRRLLRGAGASREDGSHRLKCRAISRREAEEHLSFSMSEGFLDLICFRGLASRLLHCRENKNLQRCIYEPEFFCIIDQYGFN